MTPPTPPKGPPKRGQKDTLSDRNLDEDGDLYPKREITQVTDQFSMYRKLEKLDGLLQNTIQHVKELPDIKSKVEATGRQLTDIGAKVEVLDNRVDRVERQLDHGHDCYQVDVIAKISENGKKSAADLQTDIQSGIKVGEKLNYIEENVKSIQSGRKWLVGTIVGLALPILGSIGSAIWFAADLSARMEAQERSQQQRMEQVERTITSSSRQHTKAIQVLDQQIERAGKTVPAADVKQQDWYKRLPEVDRRKLDALLKSSGER